MSKIDALRRFLLPCFNSTPTSPAPPLTITTKRRLSTSLRDDLIDPKQAKNSSSDQEDDDSSYPTTPLTNAANSSNTTTSAAAASLSAPPRSSKTMVIGTIFGQRRGGHVWFCVQHDRLVTKPSLLLELSIPTTTLIQEMQSGLVRIALEFTSGSSPDPELTRCHLHSIPIWTLCCNGRKIGFAARRRATQSTRTMLKTMQSITVGAGVIPSGSGRVSGTETEEVLYMRANYECIIGGADSESFHLINPDEGPGQEFSIFLLRSN